MPLLCANITLNAMPQRAFVAKELSTLFGVLANPHRIRIVEELRSGEMDVNSLQAVLGVTHSRVSQQLAVLRSHRIVTERREGRHVFYSLAQPRMAQWLLGGLEFIEGELQMGEEIRRALNEVRTLWTVEESPSGQNGHNQNGHAEQKPRDPVALPNRN
jgi:DNA-binding transcriptional ArsR family regulator